MRALPIKKTSPRLCRGINTLRKEAQGDPPQSQGLEMGRLNRQLNLIRPPVDQRMY